VHKVLSCIGVGIVVLSLGTATVYGRPGLGWPGHGGGFDGGPGLFSPFLLEKLDLTDGQKSQLQQIQENHHATFKALIGEIHALRAQVGEKFFAPGAVQSGDFTAQLARAAELRQQLIQEGFTAALEIRAVLTEEQLTKANELRKKFQALHEEMRNLHGADF